MPCLYFSNTVKTYCLVLISETYSLITWVFIAVIVYSNNYLKTSSTKYFHHWKTKIPLITKSRVYFTKKMITDGSLPFQMTYGWNCSHCQVSIMPLCRKISEMYCSVCSRFFLTKSLHSVWTKN